jgi:hypothetical protein
MINTQHYFDSIVTYTENPDELLDLGEERLMTFIGWLDDQVTELDAKVSAYPLDMRNPFTVDKEYKKLIAQRTALEDVYYTACYYAKTYMTYADTLVCNLEN